MNDLIALLGALFVGYICFVGILYMLGKIFFPALTKEQLRELKRYRKNLSRQKALTSK